MMHADSVIHPLCLQHETGPFEVGRALTRCTCMLQISACLRTDMSIGVLRSSALPHGLQRATRQAEGLGSGYSVPQGYPQP